MLSLSLPVLCLNAFEAVSTLERRRDEERSARPSPRQHGSASADHGKQNLIFVSCLVHNSDEQLVI